MRYEWNDEIYDSIDDVLEAAISDEYHEDDEYFEEWVNERYDGVNIAGEYFSAFEIVSHCSDSCYSDLLNDYEEAMNDEDRDNAQAELERAHVGDVVYFQDETIYVVADENEEEDEEEAERRACATLDEVRQFISEQKSLEEQAAAQSKKEEDDVLELFQVV